MAHDLEVGLEPLFDNFGADIASFDDPSARAGAAVAVSHEIVGVEHWLSAWSCGAAE